MHGSIHFAGKENGSVALRIMQFLHNQGQALSIEQVAVSLSIDINSVQYCVDILMEHDLIVHTRAGFEHSWTERDFPDLYTLTSRGREYLIESKLV